ncbi:hypothetical protein [Knoellia flava]|uniref:Uncharacterized protein n=1 Tax=Knoellia flava TaxID=913969 RepID=A0A8H9KV29_9MICO|nr:hypothetical protein [Knoellia flava]GGB86012.1 hypothetical protein GCM10011314_27220 [Knoellia flava]
MVALILGMLVCVALALAVVALVAIPARRDGRGVLTPKGEEVVIALKERQQSARQRLERDDDEEAPAEGASASTADGAACDEHADATGPAAATTPADAGARS